MDLRTGVIVAVHQLSHTIQGMGIYLDGTVDYDQNWVCAMSVT
jgi:hypothetical protein